MSVYFQKIKDDKFNADASFVVKESRNMRIFIAMLALGLAAIMAWSAMWLAVVPAVFGVYSMLASRKQPTVMMIDKRGFFYYGSLVTNWKNFVSAQFMDQTPQLSSRSLGLSDQFSIALRYRKEGDPVCYERKIALTNMQDKSEEEILAAIRFYYKQSQKG
jgi:hypothetical protein